MVDNNSQDDTAAVVRQFQRDWDSPAPLQYVFEPEQGLAHARQCGVEQARGIHIGFLDDDNWPAENWVAAAAKFGQTHPQAGAYGSRIQGAFETPPDETVEPLLSFLAIRDHGDRAYEFQPTQIELPPGAGLTVRKAAWLACIPKTLVNITRSGNDYEISLRMAKRGWEIWYNPEMKVEHFIPNSRLQREYLLKLTHLYGLCTCKLLIV
ncbi:glycosyltransferase [Romeria aff. gracilis LEGE 07310]|uniref:Glycosyltransferase n=1 Tax=Vasconcelosia minhoensis LEGE 07310 TaxID=915328 RepID=A0A8J7A8Q6_9CYAN|nr:glycosyltransferase [Romeria aff. gracilis LEGE 07310]